MKPTTLIFFCLILIITACSHGKPQQQLVKIDSTTKTSKIDSSKIKIDSVKWKEGLKDDDELRAIFHDDTTDVQRDKLKGKVKFLQVIDYGTVYDSQNLDSLSDIKSIVASLLPIDTVYKNDRPHGSITKTAYYNPKGRNINYGGQILSDKKYNDKGQLIEYKTEWKKSVLNYDNDNYVIRKKDFYLNVNMYTVYTYEKGKLIKGIDTCYAGNVNYVTCGSFEYLYRNDGCIFYRYTGSGVVSRLITYDSHNNPLLQDRNGNLEQSNQYVYDENGNLINETDDLYVGISKRIDYKYVNDNQGNWILKIGRANSGYDNYQEKNSVTVVKRIIKYYE